MIKKGNRIFAWMVLIILFGGRIAAQSFRNPILPGFNPDPSICRVGDDYYLVTSSFTWFPGLPVYHSRDLVNWELIGHGISRAGELRLNGVDDNNGIWAPTIRYHDGVFYIITTAYKSGGTFYITAKDPKGPWSDPVWLKEVPGIDPSLFWDDDGKCYYTGNRWDNSWKKTWPGQVAIWLQEINLKQHTLIGKDQILTYGHAVNAAYAEGPHIYKTGGKYLLLMAEGGSGLNHYHAVTAHHSDSLFKHFTPDQINPVLTHRQLGRDYPIQNVGHADLVQTQKGDWYAVVLGNRVINGQSPLGRETFLCKVDFEDGTPLFNKGFGRVLAEQPRPDLPWTPVRKQPEREGFDESELQPGWYQVRTPEEACYQLGKGALRLAVHPAVADSLVSPAMLLRKVRSLNYAVTTELSFSAKTPNEQAGIILYRTANGYYSLLKGASEITLVKKDLGKKEIIGTVPYQGADVYLRVVVHGTTGEFSYGRSMETMTAIGGEQNMDAISDNRYNKFTGTGVGVYATSNGKPGRNTASYDWFELKSVR